MLGRIGWVLPQVIKSKPGSWLGTSVHIDRTTHTSSITFASSGYSSLTSMPALPYLANLNVDFIRAVLRRLRFLADSGSWPWYFARAGFGSNVSTWDGPPFMNRWMTCLAFGAKCGGFGA